MSDYRQYLKTLRRVPDDIVLAVASREINPDEPESCICGWVLREQVANMAGVAADDLDIYGSVVRETVPRAFGTEIRCAALFGGTEREWTNVFCGIVEDTPAVERAFVERVLEAVR